MIHIGKIDLKTSNEAARISANISFRGNERTLWFEVSGQYSQYLCHERSDAFVLAVMQLAMQYGEEITSETPMTDRLYEQLNDQFLPAFNRINNLHLAIHAPVAPEVEHLEGGDRIGTVTSSPFLDPSGMLGFLTLASPERVGFLDGKEALYGRADRVCFEAG
jgi:hypothetical protein